jgi:hypothetical protein
MLVVPITILELSRATRRAFREINGQTYVRITDRSASARRAVHRAFATARRTLGCHWPTTAPSQRTSLQPHRKTDVTALTVT